MIDDWDTAKPAARAPLDLDRLSIEEMEERVREFEAEIARYRQAIARKRDHRGNADRLFRN